MLINFTRRQQLPRSKYKIDLNFKINGHRNFIHQRDYEIQQSSRSDSTINPSSEI